MIKGSSRDYYMFCKELFNHWNLFLIVLVYDQLATNFLSYGLHVNLFNGV
jgi:hypothetical protein